MDEFWIEPVALDGPRATIRASFNDFSITIVVTRKDNEPISEDDAEHASKSVIAHMPVR